MYLLTYLYNRSLLLFKIAVESQYKSSNSHALCHATSDQLLLLMTSMEPSIILRRDLYYPNFLAVSSIQYIVGLYVLAPFIRDCSMTTALLAIRTFLTTLPGAIFRTVRADISFLITLIARVTKNKANKQSI